MVVCNVSSMIGGLIAWIPSGPDPLIMKQRARSKSAWLLARLEFIHPTQSLVGLSQYLVIR